MTRLAHDRDTHLTPPEIAAEALRQCEENRSEPSIRSLASALRVAPTAIYHHFPSRALIVRAALELVWAEAMDEAFTLGSVLFAANRRIANAELAPDRVGGWSLSGAPFDAVVDLSVVDRERDEQLFAQGLDRLLRSFNAD